MNTAVAADSGWFLGSFWVRPADSSTAERQRANTDCEAFVSSEMSDATVGSSVVGCVAAFVMVSVSARIAVSCPVSSALPPTAQRSARALPYANISMSELNHLPHGGAVVQTVEPLVDLLELEPPAHQPVHRQTAALIQLDKARNVARRHAGADIAAFDRALLGHEINDRQGQGRR